MPRCRGLVRLTTGRRRPGLTSGRRRPQVLGVAFAHDGRLLCSASADRTSRVWDPAVAGGAGGGEAACLAVIESVHSLSVGPGEPACARAVRPDGIPMAAFSLFRLTHFLPAGAGFLRCFLPCRRRRRLAAGGVGVGGQHGTLRTPGPRRRRIRGEESAHRHQVGPVQGGAAAGSGWEMRMCVLLVGSADMEWRAGTIVCFGFVRVRGFSAGKGVWVRARERGRERGRKDWKAGKIRQEIGTWREEGDLRRERGRLRGRATRCACGTSTRPSPCDWR